MAAASSAHYFGPQMQQPASLQNNAAAPVIALSPHTLLATNRFVCEVCNKGFQREQNLQLHRRGHNLPWKLKQKNPKETRRRVYLCPEPSCVHHDPSRALGDLTGIKKHYSRKHGEKKWKCDKCNKRYAVQSDWKAHSKTCGTREYRCDCGTLFSRRDSFITHRAFCDALAQESGRMPPMGAALYGAAAGMAIGGLTGMAASQLQSFQDHSAITTANAAAQFDHLMATSSAAASPAFRAAQPTSSSTSPFYLGGGGADDGQTHTSFLHGKPAFHGLMQLPEQQHHQQGSNGGGLLNLSYFSGGNGGHHHQEGRLVFPDQFNGVATGNGACTGSGEHGNGGNNADSTSIFSGNMMGGGGGFSSLYSSSDQTIPPPQMSATALLQKAAQMGATTSGGGGGGGGSVNSLLRGLGNGGGGALNGKSAGAATFIMSGESSSRSTASQTAENESQLRELMMNTLSATGSGAAAATVFVGGGGFPGVDDGKLSTRDFLGVSGGAPGLQLRHGGAAGMGMAGSLDQEMK
uniref:Protein EARLY HEADING DATE 2 n=1 Tax=Oryza punctata TaxID=4537 RepID=A0A0E0LXU8_ORYPU